MVTRAPAARNRATRAAPIPEEPPVTIAILPSSEKGGFIFFDVQSGLTEVGYRADSLIFFAR